MSMSNRLIAMSYGIAVVGVVLAGSSHWWLVPLIGDTPPFRLMLVVTVTASAWLGGLGPGLLATAMGLVAIVAANDAAGDWATLMTRLVRFGPLALLITVLFEGLHASRRRAEKKEEQYRRSENRYRRLVESAGEGIWAIDRDGRTTYANPLLGEILGSPPSRLIGRPLQEFLAAGEVPESWPLVPGGAPAWREIRLRAGDGSVRIAVVTARPIEPDEIPGDAEQLLRGAPGGLLMRVADVTRLKRIEQELRQAKEIAEAACQTKDRFLAVLSHELRTPLTPVLIAVSSLLESDPDPEIFGYLDMIRRNVELEARLIDDLLDLARIQRGRLRLTLEVVDVHGVIRRALEICRDETIVAGLDVVTELAATHHHVAADHARLMQVVWNLVRNAAKFTPSGGRLTIRTTNLAASSEAADPGGNGQAPRLVVEFEDTGIGIEPDVLAKIFDAFEQGRDDLRVRSGGLGLGLSISRALAEAMGGRLTASSPGRGRGSTFLLQLTSVNPPIVTSVGAGKPTLLPSLVEASAAKLRILVVEDNADTLRFLAIVLRRRGHVVVTADCVAAALAAVSQAEDPFDLLLSDIELPDGNGLYLIRLINAERRLPGIAMSGFGTEEDLRLSREAGFLDHLTKPIDLNRLYDAIGRATTRGAGHNGESAGAAEPFRSRIGGTESGEFRVVLNPQAGSGNSH